MLELEEDIGAHGKCLVEEYLGYGTDDFLLLGVGDKTFVVSYKYYQRAKDAHSAIAMFKNDLLDFQKADVTSYQRCGLNVQYVMFEGEKYVVPFGVRDKNLAPEEVVNIIAGQAEAKYNKIIDCRNELRKRGYSTGMSEFSTAALQKYSHQLRIILKEEQERAKAVSQFAKKAKGKKSKKFGLTAEQIVIGAAKVAKNLWKLGRKYPKVVLYSTVIGVGTLGTNALIQRCSKDDSPKEVVEVPLTYTDFMGREHSDSLRNIRHIMEIKPQISAVLVAVEGFADSTYVDGVGVNTIGSGTTFYIDEQGHETKVGKKDKVTDNEAMIHKWNYIEKEMIGPLSDKANRVLSDELEMASIGFGFCVGPNAFKASEYYKALRNGEDEEVIARKLTGFRKQKGLLKREYLLHNILLKKWTAEDILNIPIYEIKDKGYLNSAIYRLELHEIMPCEKDENGKYKKDEFGNDVPVVDADGFCTFYDNADEIMKKMLYQADRSKENFIYTRDLLPVEMVEHIRQEKNMDKTISLAFLSGKKNKVL